MDEQVVQEIVDEVLSSLEPLDTQSAALLQFLKAKGIASDEELAPYLEQAGNASNVRWLAARVRIKSLIFSAMKSEDTKPAETKAEETNSEENNSGETKRNEKADSREKNSNQQAIPGKPKSGDSGKAETDENTQSLRAAQVIGKDENKKENNPTQPDEATKEKAA